jgi:small-conductance mechanosensitive channel
LPISLAAQAQSTSESDAGTSAEPAAREGDEAAEPTASAEPSAQASQAAGEGQAPAFDPALVGLPDLPQPMRSPDDFQKTLELIDARIAEKTAALEAAQAEIAEASERSAAAEASAGSGVDSDGSVDAAEADAAVSAASETELSLLEARAAAIEQRLELLREMRLAVQRNATLAGRLAESEQELAGLRQRLDLIEEQGLSLEPPFPVSQLDQARAEALLKESMEEVAETRAVTAERRQVAAEKALSAAVRERRTARDQLASAEAEGSDPARRDALAEELERARLNEILARQALAAAERALELARQEDLLAETSQALLAERIAYLGERVELPAEALEVQLAEIESAKEEMRAQIDALQRSGDEAEAKLYRARQRLADADSDADSMALEEWVSARQAELTAARTSVDSLTSAIANLEQMTSLWQQRYELMQDPEALDLASLLREVIMETAAAIKAKDAMESRLNSLRSMQLAQTRRLRDAGVSDAVREAMAARSAAHDLAERYGRELLETQEALIALLQGMRPQIEALVQERNLSLQLIQAQETIADWWEAELLVIDDQSIRVRELITAVAMFIVVVLVVSLIRFGARRALNRRKAKAASTETAGDLRLALSAIAGNTSQLFVLIAAFYVAMVFSGLASPTVKTWLWNLLIVAFYIQLGIWANAAMADYFGRKRSRQEMRDPSTVTGYGVMMVFLRVGIWITVIVSLLAYFKYPIAGLLGALGVGSVAVGFALQNILGDVFSSMAIILDKPFRVGDFVKAGDTIGVIEYTGIKTTRIRSLSGEQVVLSNSDLLGSRIHNYKHFKERRIAFRIGVVYQTPRALLQQIPGMLRDAVEAQPRTRFDRAHFAEYGDFALLFEVVYYVLSPDYGLYMDIQQGINLTIHQRFEEAGIAFAYPTQEIILHRGPVSKATSDPGPAPA